MTDNELIFYLKRYIFRTLKKVYKRYFKYLNKWDQILIDNPNIYENGLVNGKKYRLPVGKYSAACLDIDKIYNIDEIKENIVDLFEDDIYIIKENLDSHYIFNEKLEENFEKEKELNIRINKFDFNEYWYPTKVSERVLKLISILSDNNFKEYSKLLKELDLIYELVYFQLNYNFNVSRIIFENMDNENITFNDILERLSLLKVKYSNKEDIIVKYLTTLEVDEYDESLDEIIKENKDIDDEYSYLDEEVIKVTVPVETVFEFQELDSRAVILLEDIKKSLMYNLTNPTKFENIRLN